MGDGTGDRLRGAVLAGAALLVLVAGAGWWRANAPATGPDRADDRRGGAFLGVGVRPRYPVPTAPADEFDRPLAGADPEAAVTFRIESETGRVLDVTELPADGSVPGLPRPADVRWREHLTLVPGAEPVRRESTPDGVRRLLQYRCAGTGELLITVVHPPYTDTVQTNCGGELGWLELPEPQVPVRLEFSAVAGGPVEADVQVVALS